MSEPTTIQQTFWNEWNAAKKGRPLSDISRDQREVVLKWLSDLGRTDLSILELGCGTGWLCPSLKPFGRVTATPIACWLKPPRVFAT